MYLKIGNTTYSKLKNLSFAPEISIVSDSLPINQFTVNVITENTIDTGVDAELYDDLDTLWAKYWITFAERIDKYTISIRAESKIVLLERKTMEAKMYQNYAVTDLMADIFSDLGSGSYTLDSSFNNMTISGYMAHHSKRYRLQCVCLVIGAYVKTFFNNKIEILPVDNTEELIPSSKIFWKPSTTFKDYVTSLTITTFSYTAGTPATTDRWVEVNGITYIETTQRVTLINPNVPASAPPNEIEINDIGIINSNNVSAIASRLSVIYFKRTEVDLDVINNAEYKAGDKIIAQIDEENMVTGFISSEDFSFGTQARSSLHVAPVDVKEAGMLNINCYFNGIMVMRNIYMLPVSYIYDIENLYIDLYLNKHRYILRPLTTSVNGEMVSGGVTENVNYEVALDYYQNILSVISVDEIEQEGSEVEIS